MLEDTVNRIWLVILNVVPGKMGAELVQEEQPHFGQDVQHPIEIVLLNECLNLILCSPQLPDSVKMEYRHVPLEQNLFMQHLNLFYKRLLLQILQTHLHIAINPLGLYDHAIHQIVLQVEILLNHSLLEIVIFLNIHLFTLSINSSDYL